MLKTSQTSTATTWPRDNRLSGATPLSGLRSYLNKIGTIVWKDVVAEMRTKEAITAMLVFAVLVVLIFNFAFDLRPPEERLQNAPGLLWVAFTFAGVLGLNRTFVVEKDRGSLEGLLLAPVDRSAIYVGKFISTFLFMTLVEAVTLPIFTILNNVPVLLPELIPVIILGTFGFVTIGTLLSAMTVNTRSREVMLPILLFPMMVPVIIAAVRATGAVLQGNGLSTVGDWMGMLISFDIIFFVVCFLVFDYVVEE